jgi:electron transfer flavoprotein alpha subunit
VQSVLIGQGVAPLAAEVASYGADRVHVFDDAELAAYATESFARALAQVVTQERPAVVLVPYTAMGKDVAPRVAARVGAGLVSDVVKLDVKDGRLEARRPVYAGKALATVRWEGEPQMATLRPNVFALGAPEAARKYETVTGRADVTTRRARVQSVQAAGAGKVELTEAQIIVSGGRGLKGPENFHLVEELAAALGAAVGASRAVVDAGWVDHQMQVGQTGKTVSPTLYVAAGISGAIQHLAGMSSSKVIVAINKDADAPIFKVADYGIVGDVFEVLPKLTAAARELRSRH